MSTRVLQPAMLGRDSLLTLMTMRTALQATSGGEGCGGRRHLWPLRPPHGVGVSGPALLISVLEAVFPMFSSSWMANLHPSTRVNITVLTRQGSGPDIPHIAAGKGKEFSILPQVWETRHHPLPHVTSQQMSGRQGQLSRSLIPGAGSPMPLPAESGLLYCPGKMHIPSATTDDKGKG